MKRGAGLVVILVLGASVVLSCADRGSNRPDESDEAKDRARLERMGEDIEGLVGIAACSNSSGCRAIGLGDKPCGGPWRYLIYSVATVDTVELFARVAEYNSFEDYMNGRYGYFSDCMVPNYPVLGCRDGRCVDVGGDR